MQVKGVRQILGKTISGIVVKENTNAYSRPQSQVFLMFTDGTYYEIYGDLSFTGGIDRGGQQEVLAYMGGTMRVELEAYTDKDENC